MIQDACQNPLPAFGFRSSSLGFRSRSAWGCAPAGLSKYCLFFYFLFVVAPWVSQRVSRAQHFNHLTRGPDPIIHYQTMHAVWFYDRIPFDPV